VGRAVDLRRVAHSMFSLSRQRKYAVLMTITANLIRQSAASLPFSLMRSKPRDDYEYVV
jgi:hypothetical protein